MAGPALWNALPVPIRKAQTILTFRKLLKSHLFDFSSVGSLRDREVACSALDLQGLNFESCV